MSNPLRLLPLLLLFSCASQAVDGQATTSDTETVSVEATPDADPSDTPDADPSDTPEVVRKAFATKFPGESSPDWRRDRNDSHEAHFKQDGKKLRADFTPAGVWIETEESIKWDDLPAAVRDAIKKEYRKDDIVELEHTDNAERGKFYDVEIDPKGEKKFDVEYRADGSKVK